MGAECVFLTHAHGGFLFSLVSPYRLYPSEPKRLFATTFRCLPFSFSRRRRRLRCALRDRFTLSSIPLTTTTTTTGSAYVSVACVDNGPNERRWLRVGLSTS